MFTELPQFKRGMAVEAYLDKFFRLQGWKIKRTTAHQERVLCLGDRIFKKEGKSYFVEYKSGIQTHYTGNVFLETISVDTEDKPGWVYTCQADYLMYACLLDGIILVFKPDTLRNEIDELEKIFPTLKTSKNQNEGYDTHGVIVPLDYARDNLVLSVIEIAQALKDSKAA